MDLLLQGRRALVTGSTKGIGFAIAKELIEAGADVILHGRSSDGVVAAADRLRSETGRAPQRGVAADGASSEGIETLIQEAGDVDILINNLGIFETSDFLQTSDESWLRFFQTNVMSGVRLSRHYLSTMLKKNQHGRILFISSECGQMIPSDMIHYGVTKSAEIALARGLAELTKGTTVTVNSLLPGPTLTEGVGDFLKSMAVQRGVPIERVTSDFFESYRPTSLLQRFIHPKEVAATAAFFSSPLAAATNGAAIRIEGGTVRCI